MRRCFTNIVSGSMNGLKHYVGNVGVNIPVPMEPLGIDEVLGIV